jgi:arginine exporter protein ArgO
MSIETMAFVLGGALIAAGVFGGGLEIKELKLPQIAGTARAVAAMVGIAFVVLALAINQKWIEQKREANQPTPSENTKTFATPMYEGMRLDACVEWAKRCGEEAATTWCKTQGYLRATTYPTENVGERGVSTKLIGTREVCKEKYCTSFTEITCTK